MLSLIVNLSLSLIRSYWNDTGPDTGYLKQTGAVHQVRSLSTQFFHLTQGA